MSYLERHCERLSSSCCNLLASLFLGSVVAHLAYWGEYVDLLTGQGRVYCHHFFDGWVIGAVATVCLAGAGEIAQRRWRPPEDQVFIGFFIGWGRIGKFLTVFYYFAVCGALFILMIAFLSLCGVIIAAVLDGKSVSFCLMFELGYWGAFLGAFGMIWSAYGEISRTFSDSQQKKTTSR